MLIEDAYHFGLSYAPEEMGKYGVSRIDEILALTNRLSHARDIALALTPKFFSDYKEYNYSKTNAEIVFQVIYFAVVTVIAELLQRVAKSGFSKLRAEIFASNMFDTFTGTRTSVGRVVRTYGTPLEQLIDNYTISTGHKPDDFARQQLEYIINLGDRIARKHGATMNNINWEDFDLHLQPGMTSISPEHMAEIQEDLTELFTEPTVKEELRDARAIYNDHRYGIVLAWYGGTQITAFYKDKEIGIMNIGKVPADAKEAIEEMMRVAHSEGYPENFANDEETYEELLKLKRENH